MRLSSRKKKERRISIRTSDDTVIAWVNNQDSITKSVSLALKAWVRTHGTGDVIDKIVDDYMRYTSLKPMSIDDVAEPVEEEEPAREIEVEMKSAEELETDNFEQRSEPKPERQEQELPKQDDSSQQEETGEFDIADLMMQEYEKDRQ